MAKKTKAEKAKKIKKAMKDNPAGAVTSEKSKVKKVKATGDLAPPSKIPAEDLARACEMLAFVPAVAGFPQSSFIGVESQGGKTTLKLASNIAAEVDIDADLSALNGRALDRRLLFPFVKGEGDYALTASENALHLTNGHQRGKFQTVEVDWAYGMRDLKESRDLKLPEDCSDLLEAASICASDDPMTPQLNAVRLSLGADTATVACDNAVLGVASRKFDHRGEEYTATLPAALMRPLLAAYHPVISVTPQQAGVARDNVRVWASIAQKARDEFPVKVLEKHAKTGRKAPVVLECAAGDLEEVCATFSRYLVAVPPMHWAVTLTGDGSLLGVGASSETSYVTFTESMAGEMTEGASVTLNLKAFLPVIRFLAQRKLDLKITDGKAVIGVLADGYEFFLSKKRAKK